MELAIGSPIVGVVLANGGIFTDRGDFRGSVQVFETKKGLIDYSVLLEHSYETDG